MSRYLRRIGDVPYITIVLVAINILIFLICTFTGNLLYNIGDLSPDSFLGDREYYRIVSAMFLHADSGHLLNNMLLLAGLGVMLEKEVGHTRFFLLYFLSGLGGQIVSMTYKIYAGEWYIGSIGASGAVFGLVGVLLAMSLWWTNEMENVTWQRIVFVVIYSLYSGIRSANIDNAAHIGGFIAGFLFGFIVCMIQRAHNNRRNSDVCRDRWE